MRNIQNISLWNQTSLKRKEGNEFYQYPYKEVYDYSRLRNRIPDLKKTLDMIKFLKSIQVCPVMKTGSLLLTTSQHRDLINHLQHIIH